MRRAVLPEALLVLVSACAGSSTTESTAASATAGASSGATSGSISGTVSGSTTGSTSAESNTSGGVASNTSSSTGTSSSGSGNGGPAAPWYAADAGYTANVFSTDVDGWDISPDGGGKHDWYLTRFFGYPTTLASCVPVDGGVLTITCGGASNYQLGTAGPASNDAGYVGHVFGGGAYFEAQLAFNPALTSSGWPAFWSMAIEHLANQSFQQWPGQAAGYGHFIEPDFFEYDTTWHSKYSYGGAVHDHYGPNSGDANTASNSNFAMDVPSTTDFTQFHRYGFLWVPSVNGSQGSAQYYFDGAATTDLVTWVGPPPATPPPAGDTIFAIFDVQHLAVLLGTGAGWPMQVKSVNVWQTR